MVFRKNPEVVTPALDEVKRKVCQLRFILLLCEQFKRNPVPQTLKACRRLTEQAQDLMVLVRHEAGALAQTSRRVRRKVVRGVDRMEGKLSDLETLYDLVHGEVEDAALDVAATLRSVRRGNGVLGRVRRLLAAGRS